MSEQPAAYVREVTYVEPLALGGQICRSDAEKVPASPLHRLAACEPSIGFFGTRLERLLTAADWLSTARPASAVTVRTFKEMDRVARNASDQKVARSMMDASMHTLCICAVTPCHELLCDLRGQATRLQW